MTKLMRRQQKRIALALLVLNLGGARAVTVNDSCERCRSFFAPSLTYKAIAKSVTRQEWKRSGQHALGERAHRSHTHDLEALRGGRVVAVIAPAMMSVAIDAYGTRAGPRLDWKLPTDLHPVQPPHLQI